MWTSPKYQIRIADERHADDHRAAAAARRSATLDRPVDDGATAPGTTRDRRLSFLVFRFRRA